MNLGNIARVLNITSTVTGVPVANIVGKNASIKAVDARRIACFVIVKGKLANLEQTAEIVGKKHPNVIFYIQTIHLVDSKMLEGVCNACQSFADINIYEYKDLIKIQPIKKFHEFKHFDLIFKPKNDE